MLAAAYVLAGFVGLGVAQLHGSVSAVWPPTGVAIAGLLLGGMRLWPAVAVGAFAVNAISSGHVISSAAIAAGATLEALAAVWLTRRFAGGLAAFERPRPFFVFLLYGALACPMIGATVGVNALILGGQLPAGDFQGAWTTWWLGDLVGAVLVTPWVVSWASRPGAWTGAQWLEVTILQLSLGAATWLVFGPMFFTQGAHPRTFLVMPFVIWAAFRFPPRVTASAVALVAAVATACTVQQVGPFARLQADEALLMLQIFLGFVGATSMTVAYAAVEARENAEQLLEAHGQLERRVRERTARLRETNQELASEIAERAEAQRALVVSEARFREFIERAPDAIVIVDGDGHIDVVNAQTELFFGYTRAELVGKPVEILVPERFRSRHVDERAAYFANPRMRTMGEGLELFGRRKDGSEFPIDISLSPLQTASGPVVSASIRDVTRRKQWERERFANEALRNQVVELSRRADEIGTLNRMADALRAANSAAEAYPLLAPYLAAMFPRNSGAVYMFDDDREQLTAVACWGKAPPAAAMMRPGDCFALRRGQTHHLLPDKTASICPHLPSPPPPVSLCIPMVAKDTTVGLFHLVRMPAAPGDPDAVLPAGYSEYKRTLAQAVAEAIAAAIAGTKVHERLRELAIRDPLTGLLNRRSLEESLAHELHRARRRLTQVGVLMLDIDHFKQWNDRHGHAAGDAVLREIAKFLGKVTRKEDIVCRYGGEEITIVLADCSLANLRRRAEQICRGVRGVPIEFDGRSLGNVTVSVGAALHPDHGDSPEELLRAADEALYRAKAAGRDRVEVAGAVPSREGDRLREVRPRAPRKPRSSR